MTLHVIESLQTEIAKAARTVAFQWPGIVEEDDLAQDIALKLLETPGSMDKLLRDFDDKQRLNAIIQIGHQIASKERLDYEVFSGNFRYSVNEVKRLLEDRALHNEDPSLESNWTIADDYIKGGDFADAVNDKSSAETDLRRGMQRVAETNAEYAVVIQRRYLEGESIESGSDKTRLSRALTALTTQMNRSFKRRHAEREGGPGSRKAITNAAARAISQRQYNGEDTYPNPGRVYWHYKDFSGFKGERL